MFVELERLPPEGEDLDRAIAATLLPMEGEEFRLTSEVVLEGRIETVESDEDDVYRLRGKLRCSIELACVRCLEPFGAAIDEELDLIYLPQSRNVPVEGADDDEGKGESQLAERGLEAEELAVSFYRDDRIDLAQTIREQIILSLPMKPLCRDDCRGLCPTCGANLNATDCDCAPDETDPRWAALKSLLG